MASEAKDWRHTDRPAYLGSLRGYRQFTVSASCGIAPMNGWHTSRYTKVTEDRWAIAECDSYYQFYYTYSFTHGAIARDMHERDTYHSAPVATCTCGFYVNYCPGQAFQATTYSSETLKMYPTVYAVVEAAGKLVLSTKGFRAEKMRIIAYHTPQRLYDVEKLSHMLQGVPYFKSQKKMLKEFPQEDLSELIGAENFSRAKKLGKQQALAYKHPIISTIAPPWRNK